MKRYFLLCILFLAACGRVDRDLSTDPQYFYMLGKEYLTKKELVIYKSPTKKIFISSPGSEDFPSKDKMAGKFPYKHYDHVILWFLPAGSHLKLVQIKEEGSSSAFFIYYIIEILESSEKQFIGSRFYNFLTDSGVNQPDGVPQFNPEYAEEVQPKK
jgi:hypothetical protein